MTREETIYELGEWLEQMIQHGVPSHSAKRKALDMAIEALSADAVSRKDTVTLNSPISIQAEMVAVVRCKDCKWWNSGTKGCKRNPCVEPWFESDSCSYGERQCNYFGERREE